MVLGGFCIFLFFYVFISYVDATTIAIDGDTSSMRYIEKALSGDTFKGWVQDLANLNNKEFLYPSIEAKLEFKDLSINEDNNKTSLGN